MSHEIHDGPSAGLRAPRAAFWLGLGTSAAVWLGLSSDWSLRGPWSDLILSAAVTAIGLWMVWVPSHPRRVRLAWLPVALPGMAALLLAPLLFLGILLGRDQLQSEHIRQAIAQPGGHWTATVNVVDKGVPGGGARFRLRAHHDWLPFLERDLTSGEDASPPYERGSPFPEVATWLPDGRIRFQGVRFGGGSFEPGGVTWHAPALGQAALFAVNSAVASLFGR